VSELWITNAYLCQLEKQTYPGSCFTTRHQYQASSAVLGWVWNEGYIKLIKWLTCYNIRITHCTRRVSAITWCHQLRWWDCEMGTVYASQMTVILARQLFGWCAQANKLCVWNVWSVSLLPGPSLRLIGVAALVTQGGQALILMWKNYLRYTESLRGFTKNKQVNARSI